MKKYLKDTSESDNEHKTFTAVDKFSYKRELEPVGCKKQSYLRGTTQQIFIL